MPCAIVLTLIQEIDYLLYRKLLFKEGLSMIVDVNIHWLPENLFTDKDLLNSFISVVPRAYGEYAEVTNIPGTDRMQIVISSRKVMKT